MSKKNDTCSNSAEHSGHFCELESSQEWEVIRQITLEPRFRCQNCGTEVHSARNVCMPEEI
ncbi:hypothetical protein [Geobacter sp. SVR]|uniref:hypothetical protein n=1 Tax=Geobacter sp. SVR TaxID=2495594 RepID=UPI00143EFF77|nr:hypothetical protein [Geobacter sp. SVR]BCS55228.1 hypothetical protein GSVR_35360 [Geobacter sp. SVR]GCF86027.1 hypothetical protein GSbR_26270 [Geobacter sp. SVR]